MHLLSVQNKINRKRAMAYIACGLLLVLADVLFWAHVAWAAPLYTPYANSVAGQSGQSVGTAGNAVGAPDGQVASFAAVNSGLTLDMGDSEEGTNALKVYFGALNLGAQVQVEFLDDSQAVLGSDSRSLSVLASEETFQYDWHASGKAYRFVRVTSLASIGLGVDAVEALGFIGSTPTQDTDGDGIPDREDDDPLVPKINDDNPGGGGGGGGTNTTNTTIIRTATTTSSGATPAVNMPPTSSNDKDGDQMDDAWETAHNLNPNNKGDASEDPDGDELINLKEYQFDTDPFKNDTDGDGMPDGWEVENGLNAKADDAEQDPDGDYITNLGEFHFDSNPYRADDISALAAKLNKGERWWSWAIFALLLALAALAFWRARKAIASHKGSRRHKSKAATTKSSLPPV